jgi:formylglycine-generating enzyme required for sulfatase activity
MMLRKTAIAVGLVLFATLPARGQRTPDKVALAEPRAPYEGTKVGQTRDDNGLQTMLVWIPAGEFTMGSPKNEKGHDDDENQVHVTLTKGFWLGQHEVTEAEWQRVMQTTPWSGQRCVKEGDNFPATCVSWEEATKFCEKFTEQERNAGRLPAAWQYSLPTEAQWEYACRAGTRSSYSFGGNESDLRDYGWFNKNAYDGGEKYAHEVGHKKPNLWGLYDMHGNVWEWCRDAYSKKLPGGTDPQGPSEGSLRVIRGGSWVMIPELCRAAYRFRLSPDYRYDSLGFRIAAVRSGKE